MTLLLAGCATGGSEHALNPVTIRSLPPVTAVEVVAIDEVPSLEARLALGRAVAATIRDYQFETTVTVGDAVTQTVVGRVSELGLASTVTAGDAVVEYTLAQAGTWVFGATQPWVVADGSVGGASPLDALAGPVIVDVNEAGRDQVVYRAVYRGSAVGVPDVDEVEVRVTIQDGRVRRVDYEMLVSGSTAEVATVIKRADAGG